MDKLFSQRSAGLFMGLLPCFRDEPYFLTVRSTTKRFYLMGGIGKRFAVHANYRRQVCWYSYSPSNFNCMHLILHSTLSKLSILSKPGIICSITHATTLFPSKNKCSSWLFGSRLTPINSTQSYGHGEIAVIVGIGYGFSSIIRVDSHHKRTIKSVGFDFTTIVHGDDYIND